MLRAEVTKHLQTDIIPFWQGMEDKEFGGFYGYFLEYACEKLQEETGGGILEEIIN